LIRTFVAWLQTGGKLTSAAYYMLTVLIILAPYQVIDFQPYYTFNKRNIQDLRVGNTILRDYLAVEIEKEERTARAKKSEKESHDAVAEKVIT
jgi:hypothetical protein